MHADCLRIITRAGNRLADEADAAQARGEIGKEGRPETVRTSDSFSDVGIDRRRLAECREVRDAGEEVVEEAIAEARAAV